MTVKLTQSKLIADTPWEERLDRKEWGSMEREWKRQTMVRQMVNRGARAEAPDRWEEGEASRATCKRRKEELADGNKFRELLKTMHEDEEEQFLCPISYVSSLFVRHHICLDLCHAGT